MLETAVPFFALSAESSETSEDAVLGLNSSLSVGNINASVKSNKSVGSVYTFVVEAADDYQEAYSDINTWANDSFTFASCNVDEYLKQNAPVEGSSPELLSTLRGEDIERLAADFKPCPAVETVVKRSGREQLEHVAPQTESRSSPSVVETTTATVESETENTEVTKPENSQGAPAPAALAPTTAHSVAKSENASISKASETPAELPAPDPLEEETRRPALVVASASAAAKAETRQHFDAQKVPAATTARQTDVQPRQPQASSAAPVTPTTTVSPKTTATHAVSTPPALLIPSSPATPPTRSPTTQSVPVPPPSQPPSSPRYQQVTPSALISQPTSSQQHATNSILGNFAMPASARSTPRIDARQARPSSAPRPVRQDFSHHYAPTHPARPSRPSTPQRNSNRDSNGPNHTVPQPFQFATESRARGSLWLPSDELLFRSAKEAASKIKATPLPKKILEKPPPMRSPSAPRRPEEVCRPFQLESAQRHVRAQEEVQKRAEALYKDITRCTFQARPLNKAIYGNSASIKKGKDERLENPRPTTPPPNTNHPSSRSVSPGPGFRTVINVNESCMSTSSGKNADAAAQARVTSSPFKARPMPKGAPFQPNLQHKATDAQEFQLSRSPWRTQNKLATTGQMTLLEKLMHGKHGTMLPTAVSATTPRSGNDDPLDDGVVIVSPRYRSATLTRAASHYLHNGSGKAWDGIEKQPLVNGMPAASKHYVMLDNQPGQSLNTTVAAAAAAAAAGGVGGDAGVQKQPGGGGWSATRPLSPSLMSHRPVSPFNRPVSPFNRPVSPYGGAVAVGQAGGHTSFTIRRGTDA